MKSIRVDRDDLLEILALCYGTLDDECCGEETPWNCDKLRMFAKLYGFSHEEILAYYHATTY